MTGSKATRRVRLIPRMTPRTIPGIGPRWSGEDAKEADPEMSFFEDLQRSHPVSGTDPGRQEPEGSQQFAVGNETPEGNPHGRRGREETRIDPVQPHGRLPQYQQQHGKADGEEAIPCFDVNVPNTWLHRCTFPDFISAAPSFAVPLPAILPDSVG